MVMGFNTDIKIDGITYHVETEPRKDAGIETTVYRQGTVIHKAQNSYRDLLELTGSSEEAVQRRVEDQHRSVIGRLRAGEIKIALEPASPA
jgi:regulator of protease activity HflC (stomatin/prohibitin superfamily)